MSEHENQFEEQPLVAQNHMIEEEREVTTDVNVYVWGSAECDQFDVKDKSGEDLSECEKPFKLELFNLQGINIIFIACGGLHTLFLSSLGKVYGCGCNDVFALTKREPPISDRIVSLIQLPVGIDMISAGDSHSCAVNSRASLVYVWGVYKNTNGDMEPPHQKPTRIGENVFNKPIDKLLSGYNHTIILMEQKVYCWGDQDTKVLGRKSNTRHNISQCLTPEALGVKLVIDVFTGGYHSFVKVEKKDRSFIYYAWGLNNYGQLGIGNTQDVLVPTEITEFGGKNIINITGGEHHTIALEDSGDVYSFGRNDDGQIGQGEDLNENLKQSALEKRTEKIELLKQQCIKPHSKKLEQKYKQELESLESFNKVIGYEFVTRPLKVQNLPKMDFIATAGHFSHACNIKQQIFFSWGMGNSYVLGTCKEISKFSPYQIPNIFFKERVLQIALGGQHVAILSSDKPEFELHKINAEVIKVSEDVKLPKLKAFRKPQSGKSQQLKEIVNKVDSKVKSIISVKSKPKDTDLEEPVRRLKLD